MTQAVPAPRRATARLAFIRALAKQTDAIRELRAWRLPSSAQDSERERALRLIGGGHPFFEMHFRPSRASLFDCAGDDRVREASEWGRRWNLDVPWLQAWAVFALLVWDVGRSCTAPDCPYGCMASRSDEEAALQLVLTQEAMLTFGEERNHLSALWEARNAGDSIASGKWLPIHRRSVVGPFAGPHPLLETKEEFLRRAQTAWDEAVAEIAQHGLSVIVPRKLDLHCDWLVRYHVRGETAAEILKDFEDGDTFRDASTVYKAVRSMAALIGLPPRPSSTNT